MTANCDRLLVLITSEFLSFYILTYRDLKTGLRFVANIFKCIFLKQNIWIFEFMYSFTFEFIVWDNTISVLKQKVMN